MIENVKCNGATNSGMIIVAHAGEIKVLIRHYIVKNSVLQKLQIC